MKTRTYFREELKDGAVSAGGDAAAEQPAIPAGVTAADILADITEFEEKGLPGHQDEPTPREGEPADVAAKEGKESKKEAKPPEVTSDKKEEPKAPVAEPTSWTPEEFEAELAKVDGDFDKIDWKKIPVALRPYASKLKAEQTRATMRAADVRKKYEAALADLETREKKANSTEQAKPPTAAELKAAVEAMLDPKTHEEYIAGLETVLSSDRGQQILKKMGYVSPDPKGREVVNKLLTEETLFDGMVVAADSFKSLADKAFQEEANQVIFDSPRLATRIKKAIAAEDVDGVASVFETAAGIVTRNRAEAEAATIKTEREALAKEKGDLAAKDKKLKDEIEERNRATPRSPANKSTRQGGVAQGDQSVRDIVSDMWPAGGLKA